MPKTLLLADDSVTIQKVVGITFANEDVELVTVDNGDDALRVAREIRPDAVLADVSMPGLDGYALCGELKADPDLRHIPVMLLTGTFEPFDEARAEQARADAHIAKPFEAQALVDQVDALLRAAPAKPEPQPERPLDQPEPSLDRRDEPLAASPAPSSHPQALAETWDAEPEFDLERDRKEPAAFAPQPLDVRAPLIERRPDEAVPTPARPAADLHPSAPSRPSRPAPRERVEPPVIDDPFETPFLDQPAQDQQTQAQRTQDQQTEEDWAADQWTPEQPAMEQRTMEQRTMEQRTRPVSPADVQLGRTQDEIEAALAEREPRTDERDAGVDRDLPAPSARSATYDRPLPASLLDETSFLDPARDTVHGSDTAPTAPTAATSPTSPTPLLGVEDEADPRPPLMVDDAVWDEQTDALFGGDSQIARETAGERVDLDATAPAPSDVSLEPDAPRNEPQARRAHEPQMSAPRPAARQEPEERRREPRTVTPAVLDADRAETQLIDASALERLSGRDPRRERLPDLDVLESESEIEEALAAPDLEPVPRREAPAPASQPSRPSQPSHASRPPRPSQEWDEDRREPAPEPVRVRENREEPLAPSDEELPWLEPLPADATHAPYASRAPQQIDAERLRQSLEKVAWEAFGPLSEQLVRDVVTKVEQIAWEVIPELAERLIREEIERLKS